MNHITCRDTLLCWTSLLYWATFVLRGVVGGFGQSQDLCAHYNFQCQRKALLCLHWAPTGHCCHPSPHTSLGLYWVYLRSHFSLILVILYNTILTFMSFVQKRFGCATRFFLTDCKRGHFPDIRLGRFSWKVLPISLIISTLNTLRFLDNESSFSDVRAMYTALERMNSCKLNIMALWLKQGFR